MERIRKRYLAAALTVGISTVAGPVAVARSINYSLDLLPYTLCVGYITLCFGAGYFELRND